MVKPQLVLIFYISHYLKTGMNYQDEAMVLSFKKRKQFKNVLVTCKAVNSKFAFLKEMQTAVSAEMEIKELHILGHAETYGFMFGTEKYPLQFSSFEWKNITIPFANEARVFFYTDVTKKWFAPFFARTFKVLVSVNGEVFSPPESEIDTTYNSVAHLYDQTFDDISVRKDELNWLREHIAKQDRPKILDLGCGTGAFTRAIADLASEVHGVDLSEEMLKHAQKRSAGDSKLFYKQIDGPLLPYADNTFDIVTSVLSFRYLDWDPVMKEITRVLKPGGRIMIIDMVAAKVKIHELPNFLLDRVKRELKVRKQRSFNLALNKMVQDKNWQKMLQYNPIRSEHEFTAFLDSRVPGGHSKIINYAWNSRMYAFCSAPKT